MGRWGMFRFLFPHFSGSDSKTSLFQKIVPTYFCFAETKAAKEFR